MKTFTKTYIKGSQLSDGLFELVNDKYEDTDLVDVSDVLAEAEKEKAYLQADIDGENTGGEYSKPNAAKARKEMKKLLKVIAGLKTLPRGTEVDLRHNNLAR